MQHFSMMELNTAAPLYFHMGFFREREWGGDEKRESCNNHIVA